MAGDLADGAGQFVDPFVEPAAGFAGLLREIAYLFLSLDLSLGQDAERLVQLVLPINGVIGHID